MITISEMGDKKLHGQPGKLRLFFLAPNPFISAAAELLCGGIFFFSHAEKCHALQKDLIQSRYKRDRDVILPLYHFLLEAAQAPFQKIKEVQPIHKKILSGRYTRKNAPHFARETPIYQRQHPSQHTRLITTCSRAFLCFVEKFLKFFLIKFAILGFQCVVITAQEKNTDFFRRRGEVAA